MSAFREHPLATKWNNELLSAAPSSIEEALDKIFSSSNGLYMPDRTDIPLRPIVIGSEKLQELKTVAKRLVELNEEAAYLMSDGDPLRLKKEFGVADETEPFFSDRPLTRRLATQIARPDFLISKGKIKFIEMNIHTAIGGLQTCSTLPQIYLNSPIARILRKSDSLYTETPLAALSNLLQSIRKEIGVGPDFTVGFFEWDYSVDEIKWLVALMRAYGINAVHVNPDNMSVSNDGYVYLNNLRIDVGLRLFSLNSLEFPDDIPHVEKLMRGHQGGGTLMLPCETASLYSNKKILAYLSENATVFPTEDQKIIEVYLPWTRNFITDKFHHPEWGELSLASLKNPEIQKKIVLKRGDGEQGESVYIGNEMENSSWAQALDKAFLQKAWILQEYCAPDVVSLPFYNTAKKKVQIDSCRAVFGTYVIGNQGGLGVLTRIGRGSDSQCVLNHACGAIVSSAVFA